MRWPIFERLRRIARDRRSERGAVEPFILILLPAIIGLAGLAYDGGMIFAAKREAYNVASAAARAGANDIDVPSLYAGDPVLAPTAPATASAFASSQGTTVVSSQLVSDTEVQITVSQRVDMLLLGIAGVGSKTVQATAVAEIAEAAP